MDGRFSRGAGAKLERIRRSAAALPDWMRRLGYYGLALLFVAVAVMLRWGLRDVLSPAPILVFYLAWVGAAAFGGLGPGLLATAASCVCIDFLFDPTPGQIGLAEPTSMARLLILLAGGLIVSLVGEKMRRTRLRERRQMHELANLTQLTSLGQLLIRDDQDRIVFWSDGCARLYGFTAGQAVGRVSHELLKTEFSQPLETIRATLHKSGRWEGEETHRRADGSVVHVASLWVLRNGTANPAVLEINNDITGRKRAEAALQEARNGLEARVQERTAQLRQAKELVESERQRFRNVLDQLPAYLVLLTPDYHVSFANRFFEERFGKCEGRRCYEYLFHRTEPCEICDAYEVFKTNAPQHWEWTGPDGRDYEIHDFPFADVDGAPLIMEVGLDITDRKQAEKALRESEQRLKLAQQAARVGTFDWDIRSGVNTWTPELEGLYGLPPGGFARTEAVWEQLIHPEDRAQALRLVEQSFDTGEPTEGQWRAVWPDGSVHWLGGRWQVLKDESGKPLRMTGVNIDITERKRAEAELAKHREHLEELVQERTGQLATANEELRESEEKYRTLFDSIDEGFCIVEMIFDADGRPADYRFLQVNPAFERQTGLHDAQGRRMRELAPDHEAHWFETYGRIALTGEPARFTNEAKALHRWYDVYAFRVGESPDRHVAILFNDITERKRTEELLRRSERRFKSTFENAAIGIAHVALDGHILQFNNRFCEITGYLPDEIRGKTCEQITLADDWKAERQQLHRLLNGEVDHYSIEKRYLRVNESPVWVNLTRSIQHNDAGQPEYSIIIVEDISERKRAEEARRESEDRYRKLFEASLAGVYLTKPDGTILDFNDAMRQMLGYDSRQELLQHKSSDFYADPEFRTMLMSLLQRDGIVPAKEVVLQRKDGSVLYALGSAVLLRNEQTGEPYIQGAAIDITERKQAEEALRRSEEQFHRLFEDDLTGDYVSTPEGRILLCNPAFAEIFGFSSAQDAVGASILDLYTDPGEREPSLKRLRQEGKIGHLGGWRKRRDGKPIHIVENLVGHFDDRGELYEIIGYLFEDTERKRAEEALRELTATLEAKVAQRTAELKHRARQLQKLTLDMSETEDRERKRMAEILHDDLQQQLAAAKFHLGLMRNRAAYDASLQATAAQIDHMLMEAIQKSRSLSHELSPAVMHHADFVETLRWLASQVQAKHGLVVHVHAHSEVRSPSDAIKGFLYKTIQELLFNIVKHARSSGARIRVRQYSGCICLSVSDRGRGFDPQELRDTTGFGLLNIRERIELLGGRMKIRSAKGKGSTFFVVVPAGTASEDTVGAGPRAHPTAETPGNHRGPPLRVLLADDHEIVRQGLVSLLSEQHTVEIVGEAANGREAVDLADRLHPDVVIMDVSMPLIDGDAATRQIKALRPQTRVIALSMYEDPEKREMMQRAGAERYVLKTAPSEELLAAIRGQPAAA